MFVIEVPYFNLNKTYQSGQHLRWIKLRDSKYVIPHKDKALKVEQQKDRLIMSCNNEDFYNIWFDYFDLKTDYMQINFAMKKIDELKAISVRGKGIHIINKDPFEAIVIELLLKDKNEFSVPRILSDFSESFGIYHKQSMREAGKVSWYEFPMPIDILENQDNFTKYTKHAKMGILTLCENIEEGLWNPWNDFSGNVKDFIKIYKKVPGMTPDLIRRILLYGYHQTQYIPKDIESVFEKNFECDSDTFAEWNVEEDKSNIKGLIYQNVKYDYLNPPDGGLVWD